MAVHAGKQICLVLVAHLLFGLAVSCAYAAGPSVSERHKPVTDAAALRILAMFDRDQAVRRDLRLYMADRANRDAGRFTQIIDAIRLADRQHQSALEDIIAHHGWPDKARFGALVSSRAFIIAQHSDLAFQLKYFPMLRKLAASGALPTSSIAIMEDRILTRQGRPQKYGSQTDVSDGLTIRQTEDEGNLDARRKKVGLEPICTYLKRFTREYGPVTYKRCQGR